MPPPLPVEFSPEGWGSAPEAVLRHDWTRAIVRPADGSTFDWGDAVRVPLEFRLPTSEGVEFWAQLDARMPRRIGARPLSLGELVVELEAPGPGAHRLVVFATDGAGRVLADGSRPVFARVVFTLLGTVGSESSAPCPAASLEVARRAPLWFAPHGTWNGAESAKSVRLAFWTEPQGPRRLLLTGPGGRSLETQVAAGVFSLSGFESGDYRFALDGDSPEHCPIVSEITANLDLEIERGTSP